MAQTLALVTVVVRDYEEAIAYYTRTLGFRLLEDTPLSEEKRWVRVAPADSKGAGVLLARAATPVQAARVGDQTGGRVFLFLETDDCRRDYRDMRGRGGISSSVRSSSALSRRSQMLSFISATTRMASSIAAAREPMCVGR